MRTDRRKFLKTLGTGAASAAIVGLGPKRLRADASPAAIRFWDMRVGPGQIYTSAADNLIREYNAEIPSAHVYYEIEEWADWPQLFALALSARMPPDVSTGGSYQAMQYYDKGAILELDDVLADLKASGQDKDFLPGTLNYMTYKGHTIALPWAIDLRVIYYRKDLFAKAGIPAPTTWAEIQSAAKSLTRDGRYGCILPGNTLLAMHAMFQLMLNNGGGLFTPDGQLDVMNQRNVEAFQFLAALVKDGSVNPASSKMSQVDAEAQFLGTGGAILFDAMGLQKACPDQLDKIGLLSPPAGPHGDKGTISWIPNIMVYKQTRNPGPTKDFLKWWSANQRSMWTEGRCSRIPVRASISSDPYFQTDPIAKQIIEEWVPVGKSAGSHKPDLFPALNDLEGNGPVMTLAHDLLAGKDAVASMQTAEERLKALMKYGGSF